MQALALEDLTVEQRIGQMLLCRRPRSRLDMERILELVRDRSLGGIHVTQDLSEGMVPQQVIQEVLQAADYPILICENMECGFLDAGGGLELPEQMGIGSTCSEDLAYEAGRLTGIYAKSRGYNLVFGPILDIAMNARASCVGPRSFGADREHVARMACAMIRGYQDQGMVVTGKHYPGFGASAVDSHLGMVVLEADRDTLLCRELYPYVTAAREVDMSGVMVGHIMAPRIDPNYPASVSPALIKLLRETGYDGLTMTDSLAMVGMTNLFGLEECHGLAMAAGLDMVMTSYRLDARVAYGYMLDAWRSGKVDEEKIEAAARRVLKAQERTLRAPSQKALTDEDRLTARNIAESAPAAILRGVESAAVDPGARHLVLLQVGNDFIDPVTGETHAEFRRSGLENLVRRHFPRAEVLTINEFPSQRQMERAAARSMEHESVILVASATTAAYVGSADLTKRFLALVDGMAHKISAAVLIGNPYAARELPKIPRLVVAYDHGGVEEAALRILAGKLEPRGKVPVPLDAGGNGG